MHPLVDFLLPSACFVCGRRLGPYQHLGACLGCWSDLPRLAPPVCPACGLPRPPATDLLGPAGGRCAACVLSPPAIDAVLAAVAYDGPARALMLRAKLSPRRELLRPLGLRLGLLLRRWIPARECTQIVPVPSHPWTSLRRGFGPAAELARPVARILATPLEKRRLVRRFAAAGSSRKSAAGPRRDLAGRAFRTRGGLDGARVLIIDDVMTTGATLEACALSLKAAGAARVFAAVWARSLPSRPRGASPARRRKNSRGYRTA